MVLVAFSAHIWAISRALNISALHIGTERRVLGDKMVQSMSHVDELAGDSSKSKFRLHPIRIVRQTESLPEMFLV